VLLLEKENNETKMKLPILSTEELKQFENGVIQVNGKAMNHTALGIIDAYFKLFPNTTFKELKEAFPDYLNPSGPRQVKTIFKPYTERDFGIVHSLEEIKTEFDKANLPWEGVFFRETKEKFKTSDGVVVLVNRLWESNDTVTGKNDLETLAKHAIQFGIVVNKFEPRTAFKGGKYTLEILNNDLYKRISGKAKIIEKEVIREKIIEKKVIPFWIWIVLTLALIALILWFSGIIKSAPDTIGNEVIKPIIQTDTVYIKKIQIDTVYIKEIENVEARFNAVQFGIGKSDLSEEAKYTLDDLVKVMEKHPVFKLKIEGHSSEEGRPAWNQQLSEKRAKSIVEFMIGRGVDQYRLSYEGKGSSEPVDNKNHELNRRTEFKIIQ